MAPILASGAGPPLPPLRNQMEKTLGKHRENMGKTWENVWNMEIYGKFDGKYIWKKPENQKPTKLGLCTGFRSLSYLQAGCDHGTVVCVGG